MGVGATPMQVKQSSTGRRPATRSLQPFRSSMVSASKFTKVWRIPLYMGANRVKPVSSDTLASHSLPASEAYAFSNSSRLVNI